MIACFCKLLQAFRSDIIIFWGLAKSYVDPPLFYRLLFVNLVLEFEILI
jgi:hypothetical protein